MVEVIYYSKFLLHVFGVQHSHPSYEYYDPASLFHGKFSSYYPSQFADLVYIYRMDYQTG